MTAQYSTLKALALAGVIVGTAMLGACSGSPDEAIVTETGYALDVLRLDGTDSLAFDADPILDPADQATIEFWVQASWEGDPGFDPVVVASSGEEGPAYLVAILKEKDGLILASGEMSDIAPFDFSDGAMHHVALVDYGDYTQARIDQQVVAELEVDLMALPSQGLFIGSAGGGDDGFEGAIGGFRLWDVAVEPVNLEAYAQADVMDEESPHPDLEYLAIISDFGNERVVYAGQ